MYLEITFYSEVLKNISPVILKEQHPVESGAQVIESFQADNPTESLEQQAAPSSGNIFLVSS